MPSQRPNILWYCTDQQRFSTSMAMPLDRIHVLLVRNRDGLVLWRAQGPARDETVAELSARVRALES